MAKATEREAPRGRIVLGQNSYGKSEIRLVKVVRDTARHELRDLTVHVAQEGDFEAAHTQGDNTDLMATDTMRNTVYALAKDHLTGSIEDLGRRSLDTSWNPPRRRRRSASESWSTRGAGSRWTARATSTPLSAKPGSG